MVLVKRTGPRDISYNLTLEMDSYSYTMESGGSPCLATILARQSTVFVEAGRISHEGVSLYVVCMCVNVRVTEFTEQF